MATKSSFSNFLEVVNYVETAKDNLTKEKKNILHNVWMYLRHQVRAAHWVKQPGWAKGITNPNSPLLKTWELRQSVSFKTNKDKVIVYSKKERLALIHEYGATRKMSEKQRKFLFANVLDDLPKRRGRPRKTWGSGYITIPARPLWRKILQNEHKKIEWVVDEWLDKIFN